MMYFIEIQSNKITCKGYGPGKTDEQIEITKEIYDQLTRLPADFETDEEGNIISVTPAPEPEPEPKPPSVQEKIEILENSIAELTVIVSTLAMK